ncbi:MAG: hypothetical protein JRI25_28635, partial [Deltaproteobacteria bacterium]|nr:hypothetical protein [Deltaproteobacteria bacterium]
MSGILRARGVNTVRPHTITTVILAAFVSGLVAPAWADEAVQVTIRGAMDADSGVYTHLESGTSVQLDFGSVNPLFGSPRVGEQILARDGSGYYLVATLEVTVGRHTFP